MSLENLNNLISLGCNTDQENEAQIQMQMERIDVTTFKSVMQIFCAISHLSSFGSNGIESSDSLGLANIHSDLERFKSNTFRFLDSIRVGENVSTPADSRAVLDILTPIEERSLTDEELERHSGTIQVLTAAMDLSTLQSDKMKVSILWRFMTGRNNTLSKTESIATAPSLQCQILSLNELISWLNYLETQIRESENDYQTNMSIFGLKTQEPSIIEDSNGLQDYNVRGAIDMSTMNGGFGMDEDDSSSIPPLEGPVEMMPDAIVDVDDNSSTEACCHSTGSISSVEDSLQQRQPVPDQNGMVVNRIQDEQREIESVSSCSVANGHCAQNSKRGEVMEQIIAQSKERFMNILKVVKSPDNNFLKHLFTSGLHSELLKRTLPLLQLFARHGCIEKDDIQLLWNASGMKEGARDRQHGSVTSAVLDLMVGLLNAKDCWKESNSEVFAFLSELVSSVETKTCWTPQILSLLDAVVRRSIDLMILGNSHDIIVPAGFDILWRLSDGHFGENAVNEKDISNRAFRHLLSTFEDVFWKAASVGNANGFVQRGTHYNVSNEQQSMQRLQSQLIELAISAVVSMDSHCRTTNIRILYFIMTKLSPRTTLVPFAAVDTEERPIVYIEDLLERFDMKTILTEEMIRYASDAREEYLRRKAANISICVDDEILIGNTYPHSECVGHREALFRLFVARCFHFMVSLQNEDERLEVASVGNDVSYKRRRGNSSLAENGEERSSKRRHNIDDTDSSAPTRVQEDRRTASLLPRPKQITEIWEHFITNGLSARAEDCILKMFHFLLCSRDFGNLSNQYDEWRLELEKALYPLCRAICPSTISVAGYQLLIYCVGHCNAIEGNYDVIDSPQTGEALAMSDVLLGLSLGRRQMSPVCPIYKSRQCFVARVSNYSIRGLELLWSIVLESRNEAVSDMAMRYVATLYTYGSSTSGTDNDMLSKEQKSFVDGCFKILSVEDPGIDDFQKMKRILCLIRLFTQSIFRSSACGSKISHSRLSNVVNKTQVDDVIGNNPPFPIKVNDIKGLQLSVDCLFGRNTTIGFLRESIKSQLMVNDDLRLVYNTQELKDDTVTVDSLNIKRDCVVLCCPRLSTAHVSNRKVHLIESSTIESVPKMSNTEYKPIRKEIGRVVGDNIISSANAPRADIEMRYDFCDKHGIAELVTHRRLEVLFSLLTPTACVDGDLANKIRLLVWDLLQLLPTKTELETKFEVALNTDCTVAWDLLLPLPSNYLQGFRLHYALQAIERSLLPINGASERQGKKGKEDNEIAIIEQPSAQNSGFIGPMQKEGQNRIPLVVIDDDLDSIQDTVTQAPVMETQCDANNTMACSRASILRRMRRNGGVLHLVKLFLRIDLESSFPGTQTSTSSNHTDHLTLLITCSNKVIHLMTLLMRGVNVDSPIDPAIGKTLDEGDQLFPLVTQLLKMVHWAVTYQVRIRVCECGPLS